MPCPALNTPRLLPPVGLAYRREPDGSIYAVFPNPAYDARQKALDAMFKAMGRQAADLWVSRWICPACGKMRPNEHSLGCEVVKQLGMI